MKTKKLDTRLESEGAEFLVLGHLLLNKITAYKTYTNMPGYDLVETNPEKSSVARIQVKSRWRTGASGFPIKNFDCEFVVAAFLNRGSKDRRKEVRQPEYYILPVDLVKKLQSKDSWHKVNLKDVDYPEKYKDNWSLIKKFLKAVNPCHPIWSRQGSMRRILFGLRGLSFENLQENSHISTLSQ